MTTKTIATETSPKPSKLVTNSSTAESQATATPASLQTELMTEEVWTTEATGHKPEVKSPTRVKINLVVRKKKTTVQ